MIIYTGILWTFLTIVNGTLHNFLPGNSCDIMLVSAPSFEGLNVGHIDLFIG